MLIDKGDYKLYKGDCLEVMDDLISLGVKFDMIFSDIPYGTTSRNKWDEIIPFDKMWSRIDKLIKPNGAILLFADEPFTSRLICSNIKKFKYRITWDKQLVSGFLNAKRMPLKQTEDICVFYKKTPIYNPQMTNANPKNIRPVSKEGYTSNNYGGHITKPSDNYDNTKRYPTNLFSLSKTLGECNNLNRVHPTQKPVPLLENWIKTYTKEGDLVLDFTMGSGSTGVACLNTNRRFVGIELDETYFYISCDRLENIG
ncbi:site-specific DNA-methyltransferase [Clostridioides sp. ES-W-0017-02]|nr:site-specific DNA-methyltransferase [Clostridioides sp. ES-W-0018-02]MCC0713010.1 site-specific DNA-methyltransferase [Clostridioides sp. ES-W-0017-02]